MKSSFTSSTYTQTRRETSALTFIQYRKHFGWFMYVRRTMAENPNDLAHSLLLLLCTLYITIAPVFLSIFLTRKIIFDTYIEEENENMYT